MGVYIKSMEMPTSCDKCVYSAWSNFYQIYVCDAVRKNDPVLFDGKQTKSTAVARSARADNCPLVPVPPHGDLIERKAICLTDFELAMCDGDYKEGMKMLLEKIESAPTIIPAEEESNG